MISKHSTYTGQVLHNRYKILELIGSGSMGQVFKIQDTKKDQIKALKLVNIHKNKVPFEALIRFRTEGDILRKLQHPSIIKYFDFFNEGDLYGLVMEYLPSPNLSEHLKKAGPFSLENALKLVKSITEALVFIHDKKLVHLDLKPSNILIWFENSGQMEIKILDFGFSQIIGMSENKTGGTLSYMAPEQTGILHKTIDHRADLYALGIILYEILVGQVPFKDKDPAILVYQHIAQAPEIPTQFRADIPAVFEKILLKLISKDPDDRYRTTGGLLNDLEKYQRLTADGSIDQVEFVLGENDHWDSFPLVNPFVGREKEKETIFSIVNQLTQGTSHPGSDFPLHILKNKALEKIHGKTEGNGALALIEGIKGTGKTYFLSEIYNQLQSQPGLTWFYHASPEEYETPFRTTKAILGNLESYVNQLQHAQQYSVRKFLQKQFKGNLGIIKDLIPGIPFLKELEQTEPSHQIRSRTPEDFLEAVYSLLTRVIKTEQQLVIIIDNFQYVESSSTSLLFKLLEKISKLPILFIFSYVYEELTEEHITLFSRYQNHSNVHHLILSSLSDSEVARLIQQLFSNKLYEMPKLLDSLYYSTQGNPSQIRNLLQKLIDRRLIYFEKQAWHARTAEIFSFLKEQRTVNATLAPLMDWSQEEIKALARASIFLRSFSFDALKALCKVAPSVPLFEDNLLDLLQRAVHANVLTVSSKKLYSFSNNDTRNALFNDLEPGLRTVLYSCVANYLESHILERSPEAVCDIARHWENAGDLIKAMNYYVLSAQLTDNGMFNDRQAEIYYQKAYLCLKKLGSKAPQNPETQFDLRYNALKHTMTFSREYDGHWEQLLEMEPYILDNEVRLLKYLALKVILSFVRGKKGDMLTYGQQLISMDIKPENEPYTVETIIQLGSVVSDKKFSERIELLKRGVELALKHGLFHLTIGSSAVYCVLSSYLLQFQEAETTLETYLKRLDKPELAEFRSLLVNWSKMYLELEKGNFKAALKIGEMLMEYVHLTGPVASGLLQAAMAYSHGMLGHFGESLQFFDKILPTLEKAEQRVEAISILFGRTQVALRMKEQETVLTYFEQAISILKLRPDPYMEAMFNILAANAYLDQYQLSKAAPCLETAKQSSIRLEAPLLDFHYQYAKNRFDWLESSNGELLEKTKRLLDDMLEKGVNGFYEIYKEQLDSWQQHSSRSSTSASLYSSSDTSVLKLFEISQKITTTHELDELFNAALEGAMQLSGANHAYLFTDPKIDDCNNVDTTTPQVTRDATGKPIPEKHYQYSLSILNKAMETREIIITRDAQTDANWKTCESVAHHQLRSILVAPIVFDEILKGFIYLDNSHAKSVFTTKDQETVGVFATQVAIALNNAESFARQQEISAENQRLYQEIKEVNKTLEQQVEVRTLELNNKTRQLQELNKNLEVRVSQELDHRLEQEQLLIQQSKMAAMGEMIGMIAHQWRQPLSSISTVAGNLQIFLDLDRIEKEEFSQMLTTINEQVQYLSNTINDFRDFFSPKKKAESVNLQEILSKTLKLIGKSMDNKNISLETECHFSRPIVTFSNEIMQVFLNIIKNAQDVLLEKSISFPKIKIRGEESAEFQKIIISDNAGGVPNDYLEKIFEPYFSTKDEKTGTGLGLYMSKMIVEKHCGGELNVSNTGEGASFEIVLPLNNDLQEGR